MDRDPLRQARAEVLDALRARGYGPWSNVEVESICDEIENGGAAATHLLVREEVIRDSAGNWHVALGLGRPSPAIKL